MSKPVPTMQHKQEAEIFLRQRIFSAISAIPDIASIKEAGSVQPDGTTITINSSGIISAATQTVRASTAFISSVGNFTVPHGLGYKPSGAAIRMTSIGVVAFQAATEWDATNFYLQSNVSALTGFVDSVK